MMARSEQKAVWQARIADFRERTVSTRQWCETNGVTAWQLRYWRKRLSDESQNSLPTEPTAWARMQIAPEPAPEGSGITIHLGDARIEINPGFDQPTLTQALKAVASSLLTGSSGDPC